MLDEIVTNLIVWRNLRKIAPQGHLPDLFTAEGPTFVPVGKIYDQLFPGYFFHFLCNDSGLIKYAGNPRKFPLEKFDQYHQGKFLVVVDMKYLREIAKMGMDNRCVREDRVAEVMFKPNTPLKTQKIIKNTMEAYNQRFGFNPNYDLFSVGSFLDDTPLL